MNSNSNITLLIEDFKKGKQKAFEKLFDMYHRHLYAYIFGLTRSKEDSEEIVQNAFISVWTNRENYKEEYPFEAWLFKIAKNAFLNHNRKQINRRVFEKHFELFAELTDGSADQYLMFEETKIIIEGVIDSMPPKRKEVFVLQKIEGLSRKEISEKLNLSIPTIDSHLMQANKQFIQGLKKFGILMLVFISTPGHT